MMMREKYRSEVFAFFVERVTQVVFELEARFSRREARPSVVVGRKENRRMR